MLFRDRAGCLRSSRAASARALIIDVIVTVGAASAAFGIIQHGLLHYDNLGRRPQGATVALHDLLGPADARHLRGRGARSCSAGASRIWPALVMPALVVAARR